MRGFAIILAVAATAVCGPALAQTTTPNVVAPSQGLSTPLTSTTTRAYAASTAQLMVKALPPMRFRWGRPELERLPLQDGLYQRADKLVEINGRLLIIKAHERKDSPAQTMSSQTKNRRHLVSRRSSWRPILRPASAHTESPSTRGWSDNWL